MITAEVVVDLKNPREVYAAIKPDMQNTERFDVELTPTKDKIILKINAKDTAAMQAALNSYLRLLSMFKEVQKND